MYYTFDTENFTDADYERLRSIHGLGVRDSRGAGANNRGRLVYADSFTFPDVDAVRQALPDGYEITESRYKSSTGCLKKNVTADSAAVQTTATADPCSAVRRTITARGAAAGLSLLSDFTVLGLLTKSADILPLLQEILSAAAVDDYAACNILDIYKNIPKLRAIYWDDEEKRMSLQFRFDRLCAGTDRLSDIKNPYDALYFKGLLAFLHISLS